MRGVLRAHGFEPGPTQRPLLAGAVSGIVATGAALPILVAFDSLQVEARILGVSTLAVTAIGGIVMAIAGSAYARIFGRAANNVRGGWLFGMAFGFALWAGGAALILPAATGGLALGGRAALGLVLSLLAWGAALGALLPFVHRPLHQSIEKGARRPDVGPSSASRGRNRRGRSGGHGRL